MKVVLALVLFTAACALGLPVEDLEAIAPAFDAYRDVVMTVQTRQNRNNPTRLRFRNLLDIQQSHFSPGRPTRVLCHGWFEDDTADISVATAAALLDLYDFNVIFIDWSEGSRTINYIGAANRVPTIGTFVASQLDFMHEHNQITWPRTGAIGFSLGAHIVGHIGKNVRRGRLNFLIGLDPAGPLFSVRDPAGRINVGDAEYVECIHTNGPTIVLVGAGIGAPIGNSDFFPNGGDSQPGCLTNTCSHGRAVDFYVESLGANRFYSLRCPTRDNISSRQCNQTPGAWMGGDGTNFNKALSGSFYLETNRNSPFGQGHLQ